MGAVHSIQRRSRLTATPPKPGKDRKDNLEGEVAAVVTTLKKLGRKKYRDGTFVVARQLSDSENSAARWIGRDSVRELTGPVVTRRLKAKSATAKR